MRDLRGCGGAVCLEVLVLIRSHLRAEMDGTSPGRAWERYTGSTWKRERQLPDPCDDLKAIYVDKAIPRSYSQQLFLFFLSSLFLSRRFYFFGFFLFLFLRLLLLFYFLCLISSVLSRMVKS